MPTAVVPVEDIGGLEREEEEEVEKETESAELCMSGSGGRFDCLDDDDDDDDDDVVLLLGIGA